MKKVFSAVKWLDVARSLDVESVHIVRFFKSWVLKLDGLEVNQLRQDGFYIREDCIIEIDDQDGDK